MAAALVPSPSACQLQTLASSSNGACIFSLRNHHHQPQPQPQQWRIRAPAAAAAIQVGHWKVRVSAESTESLIENTVPIEAESEDGEADSVQVNEAEATEVTKEEAAAEQLVMMLKAEGSMPDVSIPVVKTALEEMENVSDVKISTFEGLTSISLTKKTVIQATNVASELVDAMEKGGFRMHTLNLAIDDDE